MIPGDLMAVHSITCIHHNDAERKRAGCPCPVCAMKDYDLASQLVNAAHAELETLHAQIAGLVSLVRAIYATHDIGNLPEDVSGELDQMAAASLGKLLAPTLADLDAIVDGDRLYGGDGEVFTECCIKQRRARVAASRLRAVLGTDSQPAGQNAPNQAPKPNSAGLEAT